MSFVSSRCRRLLLWGGRLRGCGFRGRGFRGCGFCWCGFRWSWLRLGRFRLRGFRFRLRGFRFCGLVAAMVFRRCLWLSAVARMVGRRGRLALWPRHVGDTRTQRRGWSREPAGGRVRIRWMLRVRRRRLRRASHEQGEHQALHDFDIPHVPPAKCWACIRNSLCSFATSPPFATNMIFAPPSTSLASAFEWTPIIPPA